MQLQQVPFVAAYNYDKIIFIGADLIILRNIDFLFGMLEITATGNDGTLFNSGIYHGG